jgi:hypothetical protein
MPNETNCNAEIQTTEKQENKKFKSLKSVRIRNMSVRFF